MTDKCCIMVSSSISFRSHQCSRNGVVEHDGKWYCKQHSPNAVQTRRDKRSEAHKAEMKIWRVKNAAHALLKSLTDMVEFYDSDGLEVGPAEEARKLIEGLKQ